MLMDNGQTPQSAQPNSQGFFTPGVGLSPEENNPLDNSFNLDTDKFQDPQEIARQHLIQSNIGNTALSSPVQPDNQINQAPIDSADTATTNQSLDFMPLPSGEIPEAVNPQLGQIVELNTPTLVDEDANKKDADNANDDMQKHFADAKIGQNDLKYIESAENKLKQDDDIAKFYDFWQEARSDARENAKKEEE